VNVLSLLAGTGFNVISPKILNTVLEQLDLDELPEDFPLRPEGSEVFAGARRASGGSEGRIRARVEGGGQPFE
jgi:hypothetical protein